MSIETDTTAVTRLYREACHGNGADERWAARDRLEALAAQAGKPVFTLLTEHRLDLATYFATRPIR